MQTTQTKETGLTMERADTKSDIAPRSGCYLIRYTLAYPYLEPDILHYDGTMRITRENARGELDNTGTIFKASADLYSHPRISKEELLKQTESRGQAQEQDEPAFPKIEAKTDETVPIFPRALYRFYLQGLDLIVQEPDAAQNGSAGKSFLFRFRVHDFDPGERRFQTKGTCVVLLKRPAPGANFPFKPKECVEEEPVDNEPVDSESHNKPGDYFEGSVINEDSGQVVGTLAISQLFSQNHLREAEVELDCVETLQHPLDNNLKKSDPIFCNWQRAFKGTGWKIYDERSNSNIPQRKLNGKTGFWSIADLYRAMLRFRDRSKDFDRIWHYHLLCVPRIEGYERGVMYDGYGAYADADERPQEGAAISASWRFLAKEQVDEDGNEEKIGWGQATGEEISATPAYFRCAVHEIGHAMGLEHNHEDNGFMNTTDAIRASQGISPDDIFPNNIQWRFHIKDQERLRHGPDVKVRPGTVIYDNEPIFADKETKRAEGLTLHLNPLLETVPLGAPVRIHLKLENISSQPRLAPRGLSSRSGLSLGAGHMIGKIEDASGTVRTFVPLVMPLDADQLDEIRPGTTDSHAITLLHGPQGALFPSAGPYRISIELSWDEGQTIATLSSETNVMISPAYSDKHRAAARKVLSTPEVLLSLALGGDHIVEGQKAIEAALSCDVLRPHFEIIEAKRLASRVSALPDDNGYGDRIKDSTETGQKHRPDVAAACKKLDDRTVLSVAEVKRVVGFLGWSSKKKPKDPSTIKEIPGAMNTVAVLKRKIDAMVANGKIQSKEQIVDDVYELYDSLNGGPPGGGGSDVGGKSGKEEDYGALEVTA